MLIINFIGNADPYLYFFVFPGSWHFDICAARFSDELLQEHDGLPRVLAVEVPLLIQVTGGLYDD